MNNYSGDETVNAGTGKELTIKELTELVAKVMHSSTMCCACRECSAKIVVI
jgi:nucleoside-diphosphate-sugar epimerase